MHEANPNWCEHCKAFVVWSISLSGPWCSCERGAAIKGGLARMLDPQSEASVHLAGAAAQASKLLGVKSCRCPCGFEWLPRSKFQPCPKCGMLGNRNN